MSAKICVNLRNLWLETCASDMKRLFVVTRIRGKAWDPTKPMNSQEQWSEHATFMDELATDRFVVLGGPLGDEGNILLVVDAADESEIRSTLARDPWSKLGILEVHSIQPWTVLLQAGPAIRVMPPPPEKLSDLSPRFID
jgi:uncharacterized protein YciI